MKRKISFILAIIMIISMFSGIVYAIDLPEGKTTKAPYFNWTVDTQSSFDNGAFVDAWSSGKRPIAFDASVGHNAAGSIHFVDDGNTTDNHYLNFWTGPQLKQGFTYVISAWVKSAAANKTINLRMKKGDGTTNLFTKSFKTTSTDWEQIYVIFTQDQAPKTDNIAKGYNAIIYAGGAQGEFWIDDIQIAEIASGDASTIEVPQGKMLLEPYFNWTVFNQSSFDNGAFVDAWSTGKRPIAFDASVGHDGDGSIHFVDDGNTTDNHYLNFWTGPQLKQGSTYVISAWVKSAAANKTITLRMKKGDGTTNLFTQSFKTTSTDWEQIYVFFTQDQAPKEANIAKGYNAIIYAGGAQGEFWIDDIQIAEVLNDYSLAADTDDGGFTLLTPSGAGSETQYGAWFWRTTPFEAATYTVKADIKVNTEGINIWAQVEGKGSAVKMNPTVIDEWQTVTATMVCTGDGDFRMYVNETDGTVGQVAIKNVTITKEGESAPTVAWSGEKQGGSFVKQAKYIPKKLPPTDYSVDANTENGGFALLTPSGAGSETQYGAWFWRTTPFEAATYTVKADIKVNTEGINIWAQVEGKGSAVKMNPTAIDEWQTITATMVCTGDGDFRMYVNETDGTVGQVAIKNITITKEGESAPTVAWSGRYQSGSFVKQAKYIAKKVTKLPAYGVLYENDFSDANSIIINDINPWTNDTANKVPAATTVSNGALKLTKGTGIGFSMIILEGFEFNKDTAYIYEYDVTVTDFGDDSAITTNNPNKSYEFYAAPGFWYDQIWLNSSGGSKAIRVGDAYADDSEYELNKTYHIEMLYEPYANKITNTLFDSEGNVILKDDRINTTYGTIGGGFRDCGTMGFYCADGSASIDNFKLTAIEAITPGLTRYEELGEVVFYDDFDGNSNAINAWGSRNTITDGAGVDSTAASVVSTTGYGSQNFWTGMKEPGNYLLTFDAKGTSGKSIKYDFDDFAFGGAYSLASDNWEKASVRVEIPEGSTPGSADNGYSFRFYTTSGDDFTVDNVKITKIIDNSDTTENVSKFSETKITVESGKYAVYEAKLDYRENEAVYVGLEGQNGKQILGLKNNKLWLCGAQVSGKYEYGNYTVKLVVNPQQEIVSIEITFPNGQIMRRGTYLMLSGNGNDYTVNVYACEEARISDVAVSMLNIHSDDYTLNSTEPTYTGFESNVYNLVTSFEDATEDRYFAWTALSSFIGSEDMSVRYREKGASQWTYVTAERQVEASVNEKEDYFKANISGLNADTEYEYQIGKTNSQNASDWSTDIYAFSTPKDNVEEFTFIAIGDTQGVTWSGTSVAEKGFMYAEAIINEAMESAPDAAFIMHTGDIVERGDYEEHWNMYFKALGEYGATVPHFATMGNHEYYPINYEDGEYKDFYFNYYFNHPDNGGTDELDMAIMNKAVGNTRVDALENNSDEMFYSFDYGDAHFIVLNSGYQSSDDEHIMNAQRQWLINDLEANSNAKWIIANFHQPAYNLSGGTKDRDYLSDILESYGVDLVLQGHTHLTTRTYPIKNGQVVALDNPDVITKGTGTVYTTIGSSSLNHDVLPNPNMNNNMSVLVPESEQAAYTTIQVNDKGIYVQIKQLDGYVLDEFKIVSDGTETVEVTTASTNGDIVITPNPVSVGDDVTIKFYPQEGYLLSKVKVNGQTALFEGSSLVLEDYEKDTLTVEAEFVVDTDYKRWTTVDVTEYDYITYYTNKGSVCDLSGLDEFAELDATEQWQFFNDADLHNSTGIYGNYAKDAYFTLKFNGTGVRYITSYRGPNTADIDIYIDGVYQETVTGLSADNDITPYVIYENESLTDGEHTFMAVNVSGGQMPIDYLQVKGEPVESGIDAAEKTNLYKLNSTKERGFVAFEPSETAGYAAYYMRAKMQGGKTYKVSFKAISNTAGIPIMVQLEGVEGVESKSVKILDVDEWGNYSVEITPQKDWDEYPKEDIQEQGYALRVYIDTPGEGTQVFIDDLKIEGPGVSLKQNFKKADHKDTVTWLAGNATHIPAGYEAYEEDEVLGFNELVGGDFEDSSKMKYWWSRTDWNGGTWERKEGVGYEGSAGLVATGKGPGTNEYNAGIFYTIAGEGSEASLPLNAGKTYVLTYKVFRPEGVDAYVHIDINEGQVIDAAASKNGEWETVTARFVAPEGPVKIRLIANSLAKGEKVYVDDIELRQVGGDPNGIPNTSDNMNLFVVVGLMSASLVGALVITRKKRIYSK